MSVLWITFFFFLVQVGGYIILVRVRLIKSKCKSSCEPRRWISLWYQVQSLICLAMKEAIQLAALFIFQKNMANRHCNRATSDESSNIMKKWVGFQLLHLIPELIDDSGRVFLNNNHFCLHIPFGSSNAYSCFELSLQDRRLKNSRTFRCSDPGWYIQYHLWHP